MHAMNCLNGIAAARDGECAGLMFSRPALPTTVITQPFDGGDGAQPPGSFLVFVGPASTSNQQPSSGTSCLDGFCNRWYDDGGVAVQVLSRGAGGLSNSEMTKVLNGITLGNVNDDTTWTQVGTATGFRARTATLTGVAVVMPAG
jgi:hypothetical protein